MVEKQGICNSFSLGPYNAANDEEQWIKIERYWSLPQMFDPAHARSSRI